MSDYLKQHPMPPGPRPTEVEWRDIAARHHRWEKPATPPSMAITLHFDGACEPNPGTGSFGVVIAGLRGTPDRLRGVVPSTTPTTNNVAEYYALREGLDFLAQRARLIPVGSTLSIFGDSKLVIEQLNGRWQCNAENLRPLLAECSALLGKLDLAGCSWTAAWIPREQNAQADALSVEAWCAVTGRPFPERRRGA